MGLPGHVSKVPSDENIECEFNPLRWDETIKEMQAEGRCSDQTLNTLSILKIPCQCAATYSVQGETDSFGAEYDYYCNEHYAVVKEIRRYQDHKRRGSSERRECDICECSVPEIEIKPIRDPDEGSHGPVYYACNDCRDAIIKYHGE